MIKYKTSMKILKKPYIKERETTQ